MSEVKVNKISPRSGTTITLGDSGDTFTVPSGVTFDASSGGLAGTLTTAAQPNITSVGTLTSFTSTGIDDNATSTAITINSSEEIGIGTTSQTTNANLTLSGKGFTAGGADSGSIAFGHTPAYQGRIYQENATSIFYIENTYASGSGDIRFKTNGSERVTIEGTGNVGIGTSSPTQKLDIDTGHINFSNNYGIDWGGNNSVRGSATDNRINFKTNASERMRIDSSGNVGIGTSSPASLFHIESASSDPTLRITNKTVAAIDTGPDIEFWNNPFTASTLNAYESGAIRVRKKNGSNNNHDHYMTFETRQNSPEGINERMRIDSSGSVFIGRTSYSNSNPCKQFEVGAGTSISLKSGSGSTSTQYHHEFGNPNGGVGSITTFGSATQYNTSSDYRLKENVSYDFDATTRLKQLKPARFNFIADADTTVDGFLAHEVSSVVPEAITGTHNEVEVWKEGEELPEGVSVGDNKLDENGNTIPVYQAIDQSKLVPLLVKTIQELEARITQLENA